MSFSTWIALAAVCGSFAEGNCAVESCEAVSPSLNVEYGWPVYASQSYFLGTLRRGTLFERIEM